MKITKTFPIMVAINFQKINIELYTNFYMTVVFIFVAMQKNF